MDYISFVEIFKFTHSWNTTPENELVSYLLKRPAKYRGRNTSFSNVALQRYFPTPSGISNQYFQYGFKRNTCYTFDYHRWKGLLSSYKKIKSCVSCSIEPNTCIEQIKSVTYLKNIKDNKDERWLFVVFLKFMRS